MSDEEINLAIGEACECDEPLDNNRYVEQLCRVMGCTGEDLFQLKHASSRQRAEAFLRTIGKWKEEAK